MSTMILPTILYGVFAVSFVCFTLMIHINLASDMYTAAAKRFVKMPWAVRPTRTISDVQGPDEVFQWLQEVLVNQLFLELPQNGDDATYCSVFYPCTIDEGVAKGNSDCAANLVAGDRNCPGYFPSAESCCEPCQNNENFQCPNITIMTASMEISATTSVDDIAENCDDKMPSWLADLSQWNPEDPGEPPPNPADVEFRFCPERVSKKQFNDINTRRSSAARPLTVGHYNQVLMARLSLKRFKFEASSSFKFKNAYPSKMITGKMEADGWSIFENTDDFGDAPSPEFIYQQNKGYAGAGAFVSYIDFMQSQDEYAVLNKLHYLKEYNWFDLNQGSLVVELLLFNGNIDKFMHLSFAFEHGFAGQTDVEHFANTLELSFHDPNKAYTYIRFFLYLIILTLFTYFLKSELDDMSVDFKSYIQDWMTMVQLCSLGLSAFCIISYCRIVLDYEYINFRFPFPDEEEKRIETFEHLVDLSDRTTTFMIIMSVNILFIFIRLISLLTSLMPEAGIVFKTLHTVRNHLFGFFTMFVLMVVGFSFAGFFLFGSRLYQFSSIDEAFISTIKAILRESLYKDMIETEPVLGFYFYIGFHLFFLILQQPMLSIIIYGYNTQQELMAQMSDADRYPLKRIWRQIKSFIRESSTWLNKCSLFLQGLFGGGDGGSMRVNYEQIAILRDGRATRPKIRNVIYDKKPEDYGGDSNDPSKDITLTWENNKIPNGMMQYYVQHVQKEGVADENNVKPRFRFVGIEMRGTKDTKIFREYDKFHSEGEYKNNGYGSDPVKILEELKQNLPVTLEFEGGVKSISRECVSLILFLLAFTIWGVLVTNNTHSSELSAVQVSNIENPLWYEYNPSRLASYTTIEALSMVENWVTSALPEMYSCVTSLEPTDSCKANAIANLARPDWFLFTGVDNDYGQVKRSPGLPLGSVPKAATGFSVGYVPYASPAKIDPPTPNVEVTNVVRSNDYNIGVMLNNHFRLTIQSSCFQKNPTDRYNSQYPFVLHPVIQSSWGCSDSFCMKELRDMGATCFTADGGERSLDSFIGDSTGITYNYADQGTFADGGGIALGLGSTGEELQKVTSILTADRLVVNDVVSLVFESVNYNGNLDLFLYTAIKFNVQSSGLLTKDIVTSTFPLNVFSQGQKGSLQFFWKTLTLIAFAVYGVCVLGFTYYLVYDLLVQYQITKALQRPALQFVQDFFVEDWWNFVDVASAIFNIYVLVALARFYLVKAAFDPLGDNVLASWTLEYTVPLSLGLDDADPVTQFHSAAMFYNQFCSGIALNGLFMWIRLIKYFGPVPQLRLMMTTFSSAFYDIALITFIFALMWLGFAIMFYTRFAIQFGDRYGHTWTTLMELFLYLCGQFHTRDIQANSPLYFVPVFTCFNVFFLLLMSMYLAAMVYRWKDSRRDAQDFSLRNTIEKLLEATPSFTSFRASKEDKKKDMQELDQAFWRHCSVISHLDKMDKLGRIRMDIRSNPRIGDVTQDGDHYGETAIAPAGYHDVEGEEETGCLDLSKPDVAKEFLAIFKKAHMEIASQLCRKLPPSGAGVADLLEEGQMEYREPAGDSTLAQTSDMQGNNDDPPAIGIVDRPVERKDFIFVQTKEAKLLQDEEHLAWEIWLDSLVTVLECAGTLQDLQSFFLPPPMLTPKKPHEWGQFRQRKVKMERRLDLFLKWLKEETNIRHYMFLKESAAAKERVLKQQSLVLTDYLEHLDEQIKIFADDIKVLEQRTAEMRAHVSPLL